MPNVKHVIKSFADAQRLFVGAKAYAIKLQNNTNLICESFFVAGVQHVTGYAVAFHGNKIIRYLPDGSIWLNSHNQISPSWKRRIATYTPLVYDAGCIIVNRHYVEYHDGITVKP